jgi:ketosteroid isomerase-like protein
MPNDELPEHPHLTLVRRYLRSIEEEADEACLADFFTEDARQRELPNRLVENGATRNLADMLAGNRKGRKVVQNQRYAIHSALVEGDRVAIELTWTAQLRLPLGRLTVGDSMRADCAMFFRFRDGRIAEQHNFDCFEPF